MLLYFFRWRNKGKGKSVQEVQEFEALSSDCNSELIGQASFSPPRGCYHFKDTEMPHCCRPENIKDNKGGREVEVWRDGGGERGSTPTNCIAVASNLSGVKSLNPIVDSGQGGGGGGVKTLLLKQHSVRPEAKCAHKIHEKIQYWWTRAPPWSYAT